MLCYQLTDLSPAVHGLFARHAGTFLIHPCLLGNGRLPEALAQRRVQFLRAEEGKADQTGASKREGAGAAGLLGAMGAVAAGPHRTARGLAPGPPHPATGAQGRRETADGVPGPVARADPTGGRGGSPMVPDEAQAQTPAAEARHERLKRRWEEASVEERHRWIGQGDPIVRKHFQAEGPLPMRSLWSAIIPDAHQEAERPSQEAAA